MWAFLIYPVWNLRRLEIWNFIFNSGRSFCHYSFNYFFPFFPLLLKPLLSWFGKSISPSMCLSFSLQCLFYSVLLPPGTVLHLNFQPSISFLVLFIYYFPHQCVLYLNYYTFSYQLFSHMVSFLLYNTTVFPYAFGYTYNLILNSPVPGVCFVVFPL